MIEVTNVSKSFEKKIDNKKTIKFLADESISFNLNVKLSTIS